MIKRSFMCFPSFKEKAVTFSYDDGVIFDKRLIEIFKKYGLKGTFNINSGLYDGYRRLTKEQAIELYSCPEVEVAVHGYKHLSLANVDLGVATADVMQDRLDLEKTFNKIVKGMAYANGSFDDNVIDILKNCGINYSRTAAQSESLELPANWYAWTGTCHHSNPKLMEFAQKLLEYKRPEYFWGYYPKLLYVWGHSYEFNDKNNWEVIEELAKYVSGKEDVWYATNGEIFDYVTAYDNLQWAADCSYVYNPSALDVYVNYCGNELIVPAGKTIKT